MATVDAPRVTRHWGALVRTLFTNWVGYHHVEVRSTYRVVRRPGRPDIIVARSPKRPVPYARWRVPSRWFFFLDTGHDGEASWAFVPTRPRRLYASLVAHGWVLDERRGDVAMWPAPPTGDTAATS